MIQTCPRCGSEDVAPLPFSFNYVLLCVVKDGEKRRYRHWECDECGLMFYVRHEDD